MDSYVKDIMRRVLRDIEHKVEKLREEGAPSEDILWLLLEHFPEGV